MTGFCQEHHLRCEQCNSSHHIGRHFTSDGPESFYVFTGGDHYQELCTFLITHQGHNLRMYVEQTQQGS